jgi:hypothetical protein
MEIRIDTKKDSSEDIRKTIEFLKTLIDASNSSGSSNGSSFNASSEAASGIIGLFGDTPVLSNDTAKASGDEEEEEEKDKADKIELIPY